VDDIDLGMGKDQPHDATTGSQDNDISGFDFHLDHQYSPAPERGPSRVSRYRQVFSVGRENETEPEKGAEQGECTCVWFWPDTAPDSEDADETTKFVWHILRFRESREGKRYVISTSSRS